MEPLQLAQIAIGVAAAALLVSLVSVVLLLRARRQLARLNNSSGEVDIISVTTGHADAIDELRRAMARLSHQVKDVQGEVSTTFRHLAVVRFNALSDIGGRFSFSVAILDDSATGIVLTSIQGHQQARIYAKAVFNGECDVPLSPEEEQAIESARPKESR